MNDQLELNWSNKMLLDLMKECLTEADLDKIDHLKLKSEDKKIIFEITATKASEQNFEIETGDSLNIAFGKD
ncbi:hypothetical protein [Enterococcus avium]|uniref:hypothetical protein n=1 Tax=Enterococcus avium TaxID=33945 RepID=UPI00288D035B|nr:hypothetical protein [Enterococcus avium]MDT2485044.1 hypothetical protein [Enterococcus avium]MDT2511630.1 hypothetical protein [Enterococcus avium]